MICPTDPSGVMGFERAVGDEDGDGETGWLIDFPKTHPPEMGVAR